MDNKMDDNHNPSQPGTSPINPSVADSTRETKEGIILQSLANGITHQQNVDVKMTVDMQANNHPNESKINDNEANTPSKQKQSVHSSTPTDADSGNRNLVDELSSRDKHNVDVKTRLETLKNHPNKSTNNEADNPSEQ